VIFLFLLLWFTWPAFAAGVELHIEYSAIQKVLAQQMFSQDGRMFVQGTAQTHCSYAYLESPVVSGLDGRIEIQAKFSGKNATSLFGYCLGLGDTFPLRILAEPYYHNGMIRLKDVIVDSGGRDSLYAKRVRWNITQGLPQKFEYNVSDEAKRILERTRSGEPYQQQLQNFQVSAIRITPAALVLTLEFTLVVK